MSKKVIIMWIIALISFLIGAKLLLSFGGWTLFWAIFFLTLCNNISNNLQK